MDIPELKKDYLERVKYLVKKYNKINIIYLRVSTRKKNEEGKYTQDEEDQLPKILEEFNLEKKQCLIIRSKESAYQIKKDNSRIFNIVKDIIRDGSYADIEKNIYVWHLNRIYRNREKLVDFGLEMIKKKGFIISVRQKVISDCFKYPPPMNEIIYYITLQMYGQAAQEESENKSEDLKKSLTKRDGRIFTNKGNLFGNKYKTTKGKKITDVDKVDRIEKAIIQKINKNISYRKIQAWLVEKKIKVSMGQITNIKKKHL